MANAEDITSQRELLEAHRQTLAAYLRRAALQGEAHAVPEVTHGIRQARAGISRCKATLRDWGENVNDHPDDSVTTPLSSDKYKTRQQVLRKIMSSWISEVLQKSLYFSQAIIPNLLIDPALE